MSSSDDPEIIRKPRKELDAPDGVDDGSIDLLDGSNRGRRTFLKGIGATAAGAVALGSDYGMVDDAEALVPLVLGVAAGGAAVGWALREFNVIGSDPPADGLTGNALKQDVYETARTRKSTNSSTFVDNRNILSTGFENTLYVDGKVAAIEALNAEKSQSQVETAALDAMTKHATTVEKNLLKSWNESVNELESLKTSLVDHPDITAENVLRLQDTSQGSTTAINFSQESITLTDGTTLSVRRIENSSGYGHNPVNNSHASPLPADVTVDQNTLLWMGHDRWNPLWSDIQNATSNVESGLTTWVSNAYDQVASGDIDTTELISPQERAEMLASEGAAAQAIADLAALNIPIASGTEYEIEQSSSGAVIRGRLALTDDTQSIDVGSSYNPSMDTFSGDAYFVYDVSEGTGTWSSYEQGIDGGVITLTQEPYSQTSYTFDTSKNETVTVDSGNFTATDGTGTQVDPQNATAWEADVSSSLENDIANINSVSLFSTSEESRIETVQLMDEFTVKSIVDAETGESKDTVEFESSEPQDDTNYITQQEWTDLQEQNQKLIQQYEDSQNNGGGGIDLGQFDAFGLPGEMIAAGAAVIAGMLALND